MTKPKVPDGIGAELPPNWPNVGDKILCTRPPIDGEGPAWQTRRTVPSIVVGIIRGDDENPPRVCAVLLTDTDGWSNPDEWYAMPGTVRIVERATYTPVGAA